MNTSCTVDLGNVADIPHAVIDTRFENGKDMLHKYPGHYVSVRDEGGAVYHVSKPGPNCLASSVRVSNGLFERDNFDPNHGNKYKNTVVLDFLNNLMYIYNHEGDVRRVTLAEVV